MKITTTLYLILFALLSQAQTLNKSIHHFGKVKEWNNPIARFTYTNSSGTAQMFLPIAYMNDISVTFEKQELRPGESCEIYVNYYTEEFGAFEKSVVIYVNTLNTGIELKVDGKISSFHPDAFTFCPRIENSALSSKNFSTEIVVVDSASRMPLFDYGLRMNSSNARSSKAVRLKDLDKDFSYEIEALSPNLYQIIVFKDGYYTSEQTVYINRNSNRIFVELVKKKYSDVLEYDEIEDAVTVDYEPLETDSLPEYVEEQEIIEEEILVVSDVDTSTFATDGSLNPALYSFNHIIFVIDVSTSMNKDEKLPLLKYSMAEMLKVLRPEDKVTIISYSTSVTLLAQGVSGAKKKELLELILSLEAKGQSYGSEALTKAYELAEEGYIEDGNNEIILASDGLFNSANFKEKRVYRTAKNQYQSNNLRLSTIAFGKSKSAIEFMTLAASNGGGSFIQIPDEITAQTVLVENLLLHSKKSN